MVISLDGRRLRYLYSAMLVGSLSDVDSVAKNLMCRRIVHIVELAVKTLDIEAWSMRQNKFANPDYKPDGRDSCCADCLNKSCSIRRCDFIKESKECLRARRKYECRQVGCFERC